MNNRVICLLNGNCDFQVNNCRSKFTRCKWKGTCNQKGPLHVRKLTIEQVRKNTFTFKELRVWLP